MRVGLVGCVKTKRDRPAPAKDLYTSTLFTGRRRSVEGSCDRWFVLSAKHGLVDPDEVIEPYDMALKEQPEAVRRAWSVGVLASLLAELGDLGQHGFVVHAGSAYRDHGVVAGLRAAGATVEVPAEGLTFGEQLALYTVGRSSSGGVERGRSRKRYDRIGEMIEDQPSPFVVTFGEIEAALGDSLPPSARRYREWWANTDRSPQGRGWLGSGWTVTSVDRVRETVTFREGPRAVRKAEGQLPPHEVADRVREAASQDAGNVEMLGIEQAGPFTFNWLDATEEFEHGGSAFGPVEASVVIDEPPVAGVKGWGAVTVHADPGAVVAALLDHGVTLLARAAGGPPPFTADPEANAFLVGDPFAFLVAVICDQGIRAERAWMAPFELRRRLGYFDPWRIAAAPEELRRAFTTRPMLHRMVNTVPEWIVAAAHRTIEFYGGAAGAIWDDEPTAEELQRRLREFTGISQKKAAMATEILERDLGVAIRDLEGSDVAYDVHLRRVFLRSGLAQEDQLDHMVATARAVHPDRPGGLDYPAWNIGRRWCRPREPRCEECAIGSVCPRMVETGDEVKGM